MKAPPIRLLDQHYDRVSVEAAPDHVPGEGPGWELRTTVTLRQNPENERTWVVFLEITLGQEDGKPRVPYELQARAVGAFETHPKLAAEDAAKLVAVTGTSILYSGLRDFLATITARGPWGPFLLPTVSFRDLEPTRPRDPEENEEGT